LETKSVGDIEGLGLRDAARIEAIIRLTGAEFIKLFAGMKRLILFY
jgi:hypothetical protein